MSKTIKARPKTSCIFYGRTPSRMEGAPLCTLTTYKTCNPYTCAWYMDKEMQAASFEQARKNYIKNHGVDKYYELGYGPKTRALPRKEE